MSTQNVAREAFDAFFSADHEKCGQLLEQIGSAKGTYDVKAAHNSLINEYYKSGCVDPQLLLGQLTQVHDKARDRDKKEKNRRKRDENDEEPYREDEDLSVLRYNQALLCVQLRQHAQATALLEDLYDNIEPIDDFVAIRISFLLLELYLLQRMPEEAHAVLSYLTKSNAFITVMKSERKPAEVPMGDTETLEDGKMDGIGEGEADKAEGDGELQASSPVEAEISGLVLKAVEPVESEKDGAVTGPLPSLTIGSYLPRHGRAPDTISRAEYRFFTLMYRARIGVALRNMKSAKKDVKTAVEVLEDLQNEPLLAAHPYTTGAQGTIGENGRLLEDVLREGINLHHHAMVSVLKAQFEYTRQNIRKAMKLLSQCQFNFAESRSYSASGSAGESGDQAKHLHPKGSDHEEGDEKMSTDFHPAQDPACANVFFNNMGCLHFLMRKPNLATMYFQKAMQNCHNPPAMAEKGGAKGAYILGGKSGLTNPGVLCSKHWLDKRVEIVYNSGLQLLMTERPMAAFKCFQQCIPAFRTWPRLWLRLAECCIDLHWHSLSSTSSASASGSAAAASDAKATSGGREPAEWPREAARACWSAPRGDPDGNGHGQLLVWDVHGTGTKCRWLLSTARDPPLGRRGLVTGDEDEPEKKEERVGIDATTSSPSSFWDEAKLAAGGEGALSCAAMCLRNVLAQTQAVVAESNSHGSGSTDNADFASSKSQSTSGDKGATNSGASDKATASSANSRSGKVAAGSSGPDGGKSSAASSSTRYPVRDVQASLLEDAALVKLAYVSLCLHDYASAIKRSRRLLEKNHLLVAANVTGDHAKDGRIGNVDEAEEVRKYWTFQESHLASSSSSASKSLQSSVGAMSLAVLYLVEALLLVGKVAEAKTLLGSFVGCAAVPKVVEWQKGILQELERASGFPVARTDAAEHPAGACEEDEEALAACHGVAPSSLIGGLTSPVHICAAGSVSGHQAPDKKDGKGESEKEKGGKDGPQAMLVSYPPTEFPRLGDTQCLLYTNLAAVHIQDGNLAEAEKVCKLALQARPRAVGPLRTLVYILLRKGQHDKAIQRLRKSRMDSAPRSRPAQAA
mmetsp:Transcript_55303/g.124190  ORF Transcript_55303/g.124190 Transcript_55303/m.124190 type:complete len:1081 (+) Transcript_55303:78-3320(+)